MSQIAPEGAFSKRDRCDPVDDPDLLGGKLDALHQSTNNVAARRPIDLVETLLYLSGERL